MNITYLRRIDFYVGNLLCLIVTPIVRILGRLLKIDHALTTPRQITAIKLLGGGNFAMNAPFFIGLRRSFPDARLRIVTLPQLFQFADSLKIFDEILVINPKNPITLVRSASAALCATFRADYILDLEVYSKLTTLFALLSCGRNRIGFYTSDFFIRRALHTHTVFYKEQVLRLALHEQLLSLLGGQLASWTECNTHLRGVLQTPAADQQSWLCLGPFCSDLAKERQLTPEQWGLVFEKRFKTLSADTVILLGSKQDCAAAERIAEAIRPHVGSARIINRCGELSLFESLQTLARCSLFWGVDSALLHYSRLFRIPTLSFWRPTTPSSRLAYIDAQNDEVVYREIICSPCVHFSDRAPCGGRNICIQQHFLSRPLSQGDILTNITTFPVASND
jgi:ADP-heptose:LPS heptosyltransferase